MVAGGEGVHDNVGGQDDAVLVGSVVRDSRDDAVLVRGVGVGKEA